MAEGYSCPPFTSDAHCGAAEEGAETDPPTPSTNKRCVERRSKMNSLKFVASYLDLDIVDVNAVNRAPASAFEARSKSGVSDFTISQGRGCQASDCLHSIRGLSMA